MAVRAKAGDESIKGSVDLLLVVPLDAAGRAERRLLSRHAR
jgi:hypothetical protein